MLIVEGLKLSTIKYYGPNDISTNWFLNDFNENTDLIHKLFSKYKDYNNLLTENFNLGYYVLNLFLFYKDIKSNLYPNLDLNIKYSYFQETEKIMKKLNLSKIAIAITIFKKWILSNINMILKEDFKNQLIKVRNSYNSILEIFYKNPLFDNETQVKTLILLINMVPNSYSKFLKIKFEHKNIVVMAFKDFIAKVMKDKENLIQYLELVDDYINLINDKKDKENIKLKEEITCYCKNQIDQISNVMKKISTAEIFINLVNKRGLKFSCTNNLQLWYENLKIELFNSNQVSWTKHSFNPFKDKKQYFYYVNQIKKGIKNGESKNYFYNSKEKTSFFYKGDTENSWREIFNNAMGTYSTYTIEVIEVMQYWRLQLFLSLFNDRKIFKLYTNNLADTLECVLYNLGINEGERIFFITRYYEILKQLNQERKETDEKNAFWYMKKITLLLATIEDLIKIFVKKTEVKKFSIVNNTAQSFSRYLGNSDLDDIKKGTIFITSDYIKAFLSDNAKIILNYYLYAKTLIGGLEIRNLIIHGSYSSEKFLNQYYFFKINLLFFQLVEEMTMNYIFNKLKEIKLENFFNNVKSVKIREKKTIADIIIINQNHLNKEFQEYIRKNGLELSDYAIDFKVKFNEKNKKFWLEVELFKTFIWKYNFEKK